MLHQGHDHHPHNPSLTLLDERKGDSPPTPRSTGGTTPKTGGLKRSRSFLDLINERIEEPSTNPDTVSLYLKFIVMLDFLAVATVVPLLPQYLARTGCCNEQLAFISSAYSLAQVSTSTYMHVYVWVDIYADVV